jgi:cytochrome c-type biogenesis protein CcmH
MLGRSYMVLEQYPQASLAFAKAVTLLGDQPDIVTDYAEAQALADGGRFTKKTADLLAIALKDQPNHPKALSLAGMAAYQANDFKTAVQHWDRALQFIPPQSPDAQALQAYLVRAQAQIEDRQRLSPSNATQNRSVRVRVELDPRIADKAAANDTVFLFARAAQGPRMPLAIVRKQVKDLPLELTLDDSMAMTPELKISGFADVIVGARISRLGSATPQSGDLTAPNVQIQTGKRNVTVLVKINQILP